MMLTTTGPPARRRTTVGVVDLRCSNLRSVMTALERAGASAIAVQDPSDLGRAGAIIVPGVAHFGRLCGVLDARRLRGPLLDFIDAGKPYLGICAGFQLLFDGSAEAPDARGLGVIPGDVARLQAQRVPHIGWTRCEVVCVNDILAYGWAYFSHSYAPARSAQGCIAVASCGADFAAACAIRNVAGVQFHPEKSGPYGAAVLRRWLERADAC
jgi:imidazole glycerol phosphate synthase glutamine amidotransferase subunit